MSLGSMTGMFPCFIMIAKLGVCGTFNLVYIGNIDLFPTLFCSTAMGICNFFARLVSIAAPMTAEI